MARAICILIMMHLVSCTNEKKAQLPAAPATKKATVAKAEIPAPSPGDTSQHRLLGQVSLQEKILLSFKVPGIIRKVSARPGARVKKGQVLAELDLEDYKLRAQSARLRLEQSANLRAQAERDFNIEKDLREKDISSIAQFQNAELAFKNALVTQNLAEVEVRTAEKALSDARLISPTDGVVSKQLKFVGDSGTGGQDSGAALEMFASGEPEIYLNAPESLLSKLVVGAKLSVKFPAIELELPASIVRIVPIIRENDRTFLVVARLLERNSQIVPGLFAEAHVNN